jgi:hypothetical protein
MHTSMPTQLPANTTRTGRPSDRAKTEHERALAPPDSTACPLPHRSCPARARTPRLALVLMLFSNNLHITFLIGGRMSSNFKILYIYPAHMPCKNFLTIRLGKVEILNILTSTVLFMFTGIVRAPDGSRVAAAV